MQTWNTNEVKPCEVVQQGLKIGKLPQTKCHVEGQVGVLPVVPVCQIHQASEFTDVTEHHHMNETAASCEITHHSVATKAEVNN